MIRSKISRMNVTDEIYRIVKGEILSHKLPSGEKINIDQLARTLEVSNIPIREALSRLQSEGYLHIVPFKGMFVNMMSLQQLNELYEIRLHLEPLAVQKATLRIPNDILEKLSFSFESLRSEQQLHASDGMETIAEMNVSTHGTILEYCENNCLKNLVRGYIEQIQRYWTFIQLNVDLDDREVEWAEHKDILDHLMKRDEKKSAEAMFMHIRNSQKRANSYFKSTKDN